MIYSRLTLATPVVASGIGFHQVSGPIVGIRKRQSRVMVVDIQRLVADYFEIPAAEMKSDRRAREVARPRQVAMFLAKEFTPNSLPEIGRRFGGRDHTTVIHAIRQVNKLIAVDADLAEDIAKLRRMIARLA